MLRSFACVTYVSFHFLIWNLVFKLCDYYYSLTFLCYTVVGISTLWFIKIIHPNFLAYHFDFIISFFASFHITDFIDCFPLVCFNCYINSNVCTPLFAFSSVASFFFFFLHNSPTLKLLCRIKFISAWKLSQFDQLDYLFNKGVPNVLFWVLCSGGWHSWMVA
jgi:hypothetical protein